MPHIIHFTHLDSPNREAALLEELEALLGDRSGWQVVKDNARNLICYHPADRLYFKSFDHSNLAETLKRALRGSRARRTLLGTRLLQEAGCLAPDVVACGTLVHQDFVVMEDLGGPQLLNALHSYLQEPARRRWRRQLYRALGRTIGTMHAAGIAHGDLRPNNVIIHPGKDGYRLGLIDNERTRRPVRFRREQLRNLKQIMLLDERYITAAERRTFFAAYFSRFPQGHRLQRSRAAQRAIQRTVIDEVQAHFSRRAPVSGTPIPPEGWQALAGLGPAS
jgi:tRNA A-37 threonylcarbamoyl transferase component Bud32